MHALGYVPDPPDQRDYALGLSDLGLSTAPPSQVMLTEQLGPALDQGPLESCTAFATGKLVRSSHVRQGMGKPERLSEMAQWWYCRATHGMAAHNTGSYLRTNFQVLNEFGFCPSCLWPYVTEGDAWRRQPPVRALRGSYDQSTHGGRLAVYRRITETGLARIGAVQAALHAGYPVAYGTDVSEAFVRGELGHGPVLPPADGEPIAGGHAMVLGGYDHDTPDGRARFWSLNSWGQGWGDEGWWQMSADYLCDGRTRDLWVCEAAPVFLLEG